MSKSSLKKSRMNKALKFRSKHLLKGKVEVWSPTKTKEGNPNGKTGDDWCKSTDDGGAMIECV